MSISKDDPLNTKKLCPNIRIAALPHTDREGVYQGTPQEIWIRTSSPLSAERRQQIESLGIEFSNPRPAYSQGSAFVYTAELKHGAQLKAFLALPIVLHVRASERLNPLDRATPAGAALEELRNISGASLAFAEHLTKAGVANRAQRVILSAIENLVAPGETGPEDSSPYKDCFISLVGDAVTVTTGWHRGPKGRVTPTTSLAAKLHQMANQMLSTEGDTVSQALARDAKELAEQLERVAERERSRV